MADKLTKDQIKRLEALNMPTKDGAAAKKAVVAFLKKNEIDDVEGEDLNELINMAEAFSEDAPAAAEEDEDEEEGDDEGDDEGEDDEDEGEDQEEEEEEEEEAPAPKAKKGGDAKKAAPKAKTPEPDDEEELDEAADEAEAKADTKKGKADKKAPAPAAPAKKDDKKAAPAKKAEKAAPAPKPATNRGEKFDADNEAHMKLLKPLNKRFDAKHYEHKMGKDGVSIRLKDAESTNRTIFVYNGLRVVEGELKGMMNFNALRLGGKDADGAHKGEKLIRETFEDNDDLLDRLVMEDTLPKIKATTVEEVIEMIDKLGDDMEGKLKKLDTQLNKNKATLEKNMGTTSKVGKKAEPEAPAPKKGKATPVQDDEDEEEAPAPAKGKKADKAAPAPAAKPAKKK